MGDDKEEKEKKEKHKDKEHKDKEHKKEKKEKKAEHPPSRSPPVDEELDQRKLFKDGQRFITPPIADSTRAFYETLLAENPDSKIAIKFSIEYGLLNPEAHKKMYKRYCHLKDKGAYDARILLAKSLAKKEKKHHGEGKEEKLDK